MSSATLCPKLCGAALQPYQGMPFVCTICQCKYPATIAGSFCHSCALPFCQFCAPSSVKIVPAPLPTNPPTVVIPPVVQQPAPTPAPVVNEAPLSCPNGHSLTGATGIAFNCDNCQLYNDQSRPTMCCRACDYDLCASCYAAQTGKPITTQQPRTIAGSNLKAASVADVKKAIDAAARGTGFSCKNVSWEDAQRSNGPCGLSSWGPNISDVRLFEKTGKLLYTVRSDNWNERLGYVSADDVAVVVGNQAPGGSTPQSIKLSQYLQSSSSYMGYAGMQTMNLYSPGLDSLFSMRFQAVFLPIADKVSGAGATEFCTEVYNYNTRSDSDPRNLTVLCTPQGTSVQQDGTGAKKVFTHTVDPQGRIHRYWLEGERSSHGVGGAQIETEQEKIEAVSRGKATAMYIGTPAMGTRFNVQMLIQLPLQQAPTRRPNRHGGGIGGLFGGMGGCKKKMEVVPCSMPSYNCWGEQQQQQQSCELDSFCASPSSGLEMKRSRRQSAPMGQGTSNAARVSRGREQDIWPGLTKKNPVRDGQQHGTITVTLYYTVAGGVPSPTDVTNAINDLNALYAQCNTQRRLANAPEVTKNQYPVYHPHPYPHTGPKGNVPYTPPNFLPNDVNPFAQ